MSLGASHHLNPGEDAIITGVAVSFEVPPAQAPSAVRVVQDLLAADGEQHPEIAFWQMTARPEASAHGICLRVSGRRQMAGNPEWPARLAFQIQDRFAAAPELSSVELRFSCLSGKTGKTSPVAPVWKRWAVSMIGVYPLLVLLFYLLQPVTVHLPVPAALFLVALILTGVNTGYVLPFLNRKFARWLAR